MTNRDKRFLLECVRRLPEKDFGERIAPILEQRGEIRWPDMPYEWIKAFLPVYLRLRELSLAFPFSRETRHQLDAALLWNHQRNTRILEIAAELARRFHETGETLLFLKGTSLLLTVYDQEIGIRPMADIDILVVPEDLGTAETRLEEAGCRRDGSKKPSHHDTYLKNDVPIELHWRCGFQMPAELSSHLLKTSRTVQRNGVSFQVPGPEASLLLACANFEADWSHCCDLLWFGDEAWQEDLLCRILFFFHELRWILMRSEGAFSWAIFHDLARASRKEGEIGILLMLADKIVRAPIPKEEMEYLRRNPMSAPFAKRCDKIAWDDMARLFLAREWVRARRREGPFSAAYLLMKSRLRINHPKTYSGLKRILPTWVPR
ncbi:MAG: hypothetical protein COV76_07190 [Candidatus Omnitrophica bacterium CG11_big_fil_rev_8_21_14_0_20_64_10]|nr:MAG: hypothetical protein COV76_07190 [Candidatus Omnitrophica bacterium CG11_big_fil_rev_8_21_14_0_20_64_10]